MVTSAEWLPRPRRRRRRNARGAAAADLSRTEIDYGGRLPTPAVFRTWLAAAASATAAWSCTQVDFVLTTRPAPGARRALDARRRSALDPTMRGHIEVAAFVEWWPRSKFASAACENGWMKQLNAEALPHEADGGEARQRQVEAKAAAEEAAAEEEAAAAGRRKSVAQQPKRSQATALAAAQRRCLARDEGARRRALRGPPRGGSRNSTPSSSS